MTYNIQGYEDVLKHAIKAGYTFDFYESVTKKTEKKCILRHDIDSELMLIDPILAIERKLNIQATYFIMLRSSLYNSFCLEAKQTISKILKEGHRLGLHYMGEMFSGNLDKISKNIIKEKRILENEFATKINVFSFHQPSIELLEAEIIVPNMINTYNKKQMENYFYISDTNMRLKIKDLKNIFLQSSNKNIQLLIHPIWWIFNTKDIIKKWSNVLNKNQLVQIKHLIERERTLSSYKASNFQK